MVQPLRFRKSALARGDFHKEVFTMNWQRIALGFALLLFLFMTVRAVNAFGYMGVIAMFQANAATQLLFLDLVLSLTLVCIWMVSDARTHQNAVVPFIIITLIFGIAGPLAYLILRGFSLKFQRIEAIALLVLLLGYSAMVPGTLNDLNPDLPQSSANSQIDTP